MRRLYVLRHAKSDWGTGDPDHERPLNKRGVRSAKAIGHFLGRAGETPSLVLSSSAVRAETTGRLVRDAAGWEADVRTTPDLYGTTVEGALSTVAENGAAMERLMIIGHEPTWGDLVEYLTGATIPIKTATVVALDTHATWDSLRERVCTIGFVIHPRMFTN